MAKTVAEKLQITPGRQLLVLGDGEHRARLGPVPETVRSVEDAADGDDLVAVLFTADEVALGEYLTTVVPQLADARATWIVYPKGNRADINRDSIWRRAEEHGWTATANVAVDDIWSAVRIKPAP